MTDGSDSFAERTGGKLSTFTAVKLIASRSSSRVPCCAVAISHISRVAAAFSDVLSLGAAAVRKEGD